MEIAALQAEDDQKGLRKVAKALFEKAAEGDVAAIREIADSLDGKVPQAVVGDDEHPPVQIERIERVIIDPRQPDSADAQEELG